MRGTLAQMVEQWTENPCVPGSIPGGTTQSSDGEIGRHAGLKMDQVQKLGIRQKDWII